MFIKRTRDAELYLSAKGENYSYSEDYSLLQLSQESSSFIQKVQEKIRSLDEGLSDDLLRRFNRNLNQGLLEEILSNLEKRHGDVEGFRDILLSSMIAEAKIMLVRFDSDYYKKALLQEKPRFCELPWSFSSFPVRYANFSLSDSRHPKIFVLLDSDSPLYDVGAAEKFLLFNTTDEMEIQDLSQITVLDWEENNELPDVQAIFLDLLEAVAKETEQRKVLEYLSVAAESLPGLRAVELNKNNEYCIKFSYLIPSLSMIRETQEGILPSSKLLQAIKQTNLTEIKTTKNFLIAGDKTMRLIINLDKDGAQCVITEIELRINSEEGKENAKDISSIDHVLKVYNQNKARISFLSEKIAEFQRQSIRLGHLLDVDASRLSKESRANKIEKNGIVKMSFLEKIKELHGIDETLFFSALSNIVYGPRRSGRPLDKTDRVPIDALALVGNKWVFIGFSIREDGFLVPYTAYEPDQDVLKNKIAELRK
jgi:hypothetical protein